MRTSLGLEGCPAAQELLEVPMRTPCPWCIADGAHVSAAQVLMRTLQQTAHQSIT